MESVLHEVTVFSAERAVRRPGEHASMRTGDLVVAAAASLNALLEGKSFMCAWGPPSSG